MRLEMTADYLVPDGRIDRHSAMVVVSDLGGSLSARAYADSGGVFDYDVHLDVPGDRDGVWFSDRVPHGVEAVKARKQLVRTDDGYAEVLELELAGGACREHSHIELRPR